MPSSSGRPMRTCSPRRGRWTDRPGRTAAGGAAGAGGGAARGSGSAGATIAGVTGSARGTPTDRHGPGRRLPDLSGLPPLLAGTGAFADLRARVGGGESGFAPPTPSGRGRHAGLTSVPHGAKSYLAAALSLAAGERVVWVARDAEIGDRVAEELAAWVGDQGAIAVLEPRTALAYERSELVADETAARGAAPSPLPAPPP